MFNIPDLQAQMNRTLISLQDRYDQIKHIAPIDISNPFVCPEVPADSLVNSAKMIAAKKQFLQKVESNHSKLKEFNFEVTLQDNFIQKSIKAKTKVRAIEKFWLWVKQSFPWATKDDIEFEII